MDKQISAMLKWKAKWVIELQTQDNMMMCYRRRNWRTWQKTSPQPFKPK